MRLTGVDATRSNVVAVTDALLRARLPRLDTRCSATPYGVAKREAHTTGQRWTAVTVPARWKALLAKVGATPSAVRWWDIAPRAVDADAIMTLEIKAELVRRAGGLVSDSCGAFTKSHARVSGVR
jgi:hypothetical protein